MKWIGQCRLLVALLIIAWTLLLFLEAVRVVEKHHVQKVGKSDVFVTRSTGVDTRNDHGTTKEKNMVDLSRIPAKTSESSALRKQREKPAMTVSNSTTIMKHKNALRQWLPYPRVERFPLYGTEEFQTECGWTMGALEEQHSFPCTFLVRPAPKTGEGIADWIARVVSGYLLAKQTGCQLIYDYGPQVNMTRVLLPSSDPQATWKLPPDFVCSKSSDRRPCFESGSATQGLDFRKDESIVSIAARLNQTILPVPFYRFIGAASESRFPELKETLEGFTLRNGMGCALSHLFRFAPSATQIEPRLFDMLHALRQPEAFVLSLYIRTFHSDQLEDREKTIELVNASIACAFKIEKEYIKDSHVQNVTWLLLTDSPDLKRRIKEDYSQESPPLGEKEVSRRVLVTSSRGLHTKGYLRPSTVVFAEALFDWYLIGESDAVVTSSSTTYGVSAAARTGRPTFRQLDCRNILGNW
jgi:hypothetical protein